MAEGGEQRVVKKTECNPVNGLMYIFTTSILLSVVWCFYSVAIEILPFAAQHIKCNADIASKYNNYSVSEGCRNYLTNIRTHENMSSSFWSVMIIAGLTPWLVLCFGAIITSHDKVSKRDKQNCWVVIGILIAVYFLTMVITSFNGVKVYLYASPAYIGVPLCVIIPGFIAYMKYLNICKRFTRHINPFFVSTYVMISVSLVVLTSYIVWDPTTYPELYYKSRILLGCAYFFAWLAALVMTFEINYLYLYEYPAVQDYKITEIDQNETNSIQPDDDVNVIKLQESIIRNKVIVEMREAKPISFIKLGHILSFGMTLFLVSWLSISHSIANITILVLISLLPPIGNFAIKAQHHFNQYMLSRNKM
jgi:hypothetical protein